MSINDEIKNLIKEIEDNNQKTKEYIDDLDKRILELDLNYLNSQAQNDLATLKHLRKVLEDNK